jgi:hypothetical protein
MNGSRTSQGPSVCHFQIVSRTSHPASDLCQLWWHEILCPDDFRSSLSLVDVDRVAKVGDYKAGKGVGNGNQEDVLGLEV